MEVRARTRLCELPCLGGMRLAVAESCTLVSADLQHASHRICNMSLLLSTHPSLRRADTRCFQPMMPSIQMWSLQDIKMMPDI